MKRLINKLGSRQSVVNRVWLYTDRNGKQSVMAQIKSRYGDCVVSLRRIKGGVQDGYILRDT
jgi:hypothetical protein